MPFGHTNAPAVFLSLVNDVLCDFLYLFVVVYLDEILIFFPRELGTHQGHFHLYIKDEKRVFHCASVSSLSFIIGERISLGLANFYRGFIKNFSSIAAPLHTLTSSQVHYQWNDAAEADFKILKEKFTSALVLTIPDSKLQFVLVVDALEVGIRAVLSQRSTRDNQLHPCTFLSRKLTPTKRNYDVENQELFAIKVTP